MAGVVCGVFKTRDRHEGTNPLGVFTLPKDTSRALRADVLDNIAPELARYRDEVSLARQNNKDLTE